MRFLLWDTELKWIDLNNIISKTYKKMKNYKCINEKCFTNSFWHVVGFYWWFVKNTWNAFITKPQTFFCFFSLYEYIWIVFSYQSCQNQDQRETLNYIDCYSYRLLVSAVSSHLFSPKQYGLVMKDPHILFRSGWTPRLEHRRWTQFARTKYSNVWQHFVASCELMTACTLSFSLLRFLVFNMKASYEDGDFCWFCLD